MTVHPKQKFQWSFASIDQFFVPYRVLHTKIAPVEFYINPVRRGLSEWLGHVSRTAISWQKPVPHWLATGQIEARDSDDRNRCIFGNSLIHFETVPNRNVGLFRMQVNQAPRTKYIQCSRWWSIQANLWSLQLRQLRMRLIAKKGKCSKLPTAFWLWNTQ